jgi:hypothetical protein
MDLRAEAKAKDAIIRYMLDNPTKRDKFGDQPRMFKQSDFEDVDFGRALNFPTIARLVKEIKCHNEEVVTQLDAIYIESNSKTQGFIDSGGFVALYEKEVEAALKSSKIEELTETELKQKIRNNRWSLPLSITGIVIALGTLVWSIYSSYNNVTEEQLNPKINSIQSRLQQLENGLQKERDSLKEELYKAEIIIAIYEKDNID